MTPWNCWLEDLRRYGGWSALLREQSLWAVGWYRLGCSVDSIPIRPVRAILLKFWWFVFRFIELSTGISLPVSCRIGPGLRIWHFGGIFLHPNVRIGRNCTLRQGVTIGNRYNDEVVPHLGDDVEVGAYAQILGGVRVGDEAKIGALSVVLQDVPAGSSVAGVPAKLINQGTTG